MDYLFLGLLLLLLVITGVLTFFATRQAISSRRLTARIWMSVAIFIFSLVLAVCAMEGYYRWIYDSTDSFGLTKTTQRWFERHYETNHLGFRDDIAYMKESRPKRKRVMFLGDSFTAGHGIKDPENRFANRIRKAHPDWDIHIFAENGWDTGAQIDILQKSFIKGYKPGLVILAYVINDVSDILPEWKEVMSRIYADQENENFWVKNSYLINTLYYRWRASRDPDIKDYYGFVKRGYGGKIWRAQQVRLQRIQQLVHAAGGKLAVVTFPFFNALEEEYEYALIHERLDNLWQALRVPHLDLYPYYQEFDRKKLQISPYDAHPNEFSHEIASIAIQEFVAEERLLS